MYEKETSIPASEYNKRGVEYFSKTEYREAIEEFNTALSMGVSPPHLRPEIHINRGRAYYAMKQYEKATEDFKMALSMVPKNPNVYNWCGLASYRRELYFEAANYFSEAIELNPNSAVYYFNRGNSYLKMGNRPLAVADFKKSCDLGDKDACEQLRVLGYR